MMLKFQNMGVQFLLVTIISVVSHFATTTSTSSSSLDSLVYVGCTQLKFNRGTPYESNVNSVLTSLVNSASLSNFNTFKISLPGSTPADVVYGLFQCRGDLTSSECRRCVAAAVTRVGTFCVATSGGALQLEGCFIKYDNVSFLGSEDKTQVNNNCGPAAGYNDDSESERDGVLAYLEGGSGQYFRVGGSGKVEGMVQCLEDLSMEECQDCLSEAIQRLKTQCQASAWGDMYLAKCYARYSHSQSQSQSRAYSSSNAPNHASFCTLILLIISFIFIPRYINFYCYQLIAA